MFKSPIKLYRIKLLSKILLIRASLTPLFTSGGIHNSIIKSEVSLLLYQRKRVSHEFNRVNLLRIVPATNKLRSLTNYLARSDGLTTV